MSMMRENTASCNSLLVDIHSVCAHEGEFERNGLKVKDFEIHVQSTFRLHSVQDLTRLFDKGTGI